MGGKIPVVLPHEKVKAREMKDGRQCQPRTPFATRPQRIDLQAVVRLSVRQGVNAN
jgi:hypothetical protein